MLSQDVKRLGITVVVVGMLFPKVVVVVVDGGKGKLSPGHGEATGLICA